MVLSSAQSRNGQFIQVCCSLILAFTYLKSKERSRFVRVDNQQARMSLLAAQSEAGAEQYNHFFLRLLLATPSVPNYLSCYSLRSF